MHDDARTFEALDQRHCEDLLAAHTVGRLAWQAADGLLVLPVTYVYRDESLVFRTSPHGVISELVRPTDVALQVDDLDEHHRSGWSVLVQGRAEAVAEPADMVRLWSVDGLVPWAPGVRNLFIRIAPRRITGRVLVSRSAGGDAPGRRSPS